VASSRTNWRNLRITCSSHLIEENAQNLSSQQADLSSIWTAGRVTSTLRDHSYPLPFGFSNFRKAITFAIKFSPSMCKFK
jgi:hypothetical protein